jgi:hypothetical protein
MLGSQLHERAYAEGELLGRASRRRLHRDRTRSVRLLFHSDRQSVADISNCINTTGYISRSVAGSYDNEAIAIFLLMFTFYLWIRALKQGSAFWGTIAALFYGYMVAAWGGYVFITNSTSPLGLTAQVCVCVRS